MIFFKFRKVFGFVSIVAFWGVLFLTGCNNGFESKSLQDTLYLVTWNVQTFFDGEASGLEYSEFTSSKSAWDSTKYEKRLKNLCQAIAMLDADILVLQEIESTAVMQDIANYLPEYMDRGKSYKWMTFGIEKDAAIGCGVFSRVPLGNTYVHQVDSRVHGQQPRLRPLMEVELILGDKRHCLFVCHWKSKSSGEEEALLWQKEQEEVLVACLEDFLSYGDTAAGAVICGDFNRDLEEFTLRNNRVLLGDIPVFDGWLHPSVTAEGSYYYKNNWEKIDHIFTCGNVRIENFDAVLHELWTIQEGKEIIPHKYTVWKGEGFSDHLPVGAVLRF